MHQRHSPTCVMRRHRTTAMPFGIERVRTLWARTMIFFILPLRGKHDSTRAGGRGPTVHRRISAYRPPLASIQRPRAWLSLVPCACMYRYSETMWTLFSRAACTSRRRFAIAHCQPSLVAKLTLVVSIVPQVAACLANTKPAPKRKARHEDETHGAKKPRRAPQVCTPADGGTHTQSRHTHTFACVRSR